MVIRLSILLFLFCSIQSTAQYRSVGLHVIGGGLIKHRNFITIDYTKPSFGFEFNYEQKADGSKNWHKACRYPRWGVSYLFLHFGNKEELGWAMGLVPYVNIDFLNKERFRLYGTFGVGLAVVSAPFDRISNPRNNVIGSYINNNTRFELGLDIHLNSQFSLRNTITFTHYSNAASQLPNLGINVLSGRFGLMYHISAKQKVSEVPSTVESDKRVHFSFHSSFGFREISTTNGPKFPMLQINVQSGLFITSNQLLQAGLEYDYQGAVYEFMRNNGGFAASELMARASRVSFVLSDEVFIGRFSMQFQAGVYLTRNDYQPWFMHFRLTAKYYFRNIFDKGIKPYLLVAIKAHKIVAEYYSVGSGFTI